MARGYAFAALAALTVAGCSCGSGQQVGGCAGTAVLITVTISASVTDGGADANASSGGDGGSDARPACTGTCDDYLAALRWAIEAATPAACARQPREPVLICVPSGDAPDGCRSDLDASRALEPQIRDYLAASWPEIDGAAVSLDTCTCNIN